MTKLQLCLVFFCCLLTFGKAWAYEPLVTKQTFELENFETQGGELIKQVRVGWEAYGTLNAAKDNVILICHYFSGNSHAAGKYSAEDKAPGYWNSIIGAGKPIDTDRFYVISVDSLVNMGVNNPNVVTTGPATINPDTGKPYGMSFPIVTIRDFVNLQKALLESLGIKKLHAVTGPSMGSLQAYEWAATYPDYVERLMPVIGSGWISGNLIGWLNVWGLPIRLDPNWNNGDYYGKEPPLKGLAESLKIITLHANHHEWANATFSRRWAQPEKDPIDDLSHQYAIEATLDKISLDRAKYADANHLLYLARAVQLFAAGQRQQPVEGMRQIKAPTLMIYTNEDLIFAGDEIRDTAAYIRSAGTPVELVEIEGTRGHLDGVLSIHKASENIRRFLASD